MPENSELQICEKKSACHLGIITAVVFCCAQIYMDSYSQAFDLRPDHPPNLVYLQTSKGVYETNEDLWFKAYILEGQYLTPDEIDRTLYLQLINEKTGAVCWRKMYEIKSFYVSGHLFLHDTLSEGIYLLAAFTSNTFFNDTTKFTAVRKIEICKNIRSYSQQKIRNSESNSEKQEKRITNGNIQLSFYPEGGNLISGINNTVAFKAVDISGTPVDIEGTLFEDGDTLLHFHSDHAGMGKFEFVPDQLKNYFARLKKPVDEDVWVLPEVQESGPQLHLVQNNSTNLIFVVKNADAKKESNVLLLGKRRGNIIYVNSGKLIDSLVFNVPLSSFFQQGIAVFTLFNENLFPVAERLVYLNPENKLNIELKLSEEEYELRDKVDLNLKVTDKFGNPVIAHFGVTVFDKDYLNEPFLENIMTHCYLTNELKGRVFNPQYYFDESNRNRLEALDLLLLTQGWRRYHNKELINNKLGSLIIHDGIRGSLHASKRKRLAPKGNQILKVTNSNIESMYIKADSIGDIEIPPHFLKFCQGGYLYYEIVNNDDYKYRVLLESPFDSIDMILQNKEPIYPIFSSIKPTATKISINSRPNVFELGEVEIIGKSEFKYRDKYLGHLDSLAQLDYDPGDYVCPYGHLNCPLPHDIKNLKKPLEGGVYRQYVGFRWINQSIGHYTFDGEKSIEYKYPKYTREELLILYDINSIEGYYVDKEFYQPVYDKSGKMDMIPDYRNTLLWAPSVITNKDGEAKLEFYCSDIYSIFYGCIEGVSGNGELGHKTFEFRVRKAGPYTWE